MGANVKNRPAVTGLLLCLGCALVFSPAGASGDQAALDARVAEFLEANRHGWRDWNVPYEDGKALHDLIVGRKFTRALEIGTSSGHSAIWIAWALSKTGGRLITVEIDPAVRRKALRNFREAGLEAFIDSRLGDAHRLVSELQGPFDFIFLDADKEWYPRYFRELEPKLLRGGCFTAHNACNSYPGIRELLELLRSRADFRTTIDRSSSSCISVSCRVDP